MPDEIDVWRVAQQLIASKGADADAQVAWALTHCERTGIAEGVAFWRRVAEAIANLRNLQATPH